MLKSNIVLCGVVFAGLVCVGFSFPAEEIRLTHPDVDHPVEDSLVQVATELVDPDFPGCSLGYFWCTKLKNANVTSGQAALLTTRSNPDYNYEWFFNGKPTCVGHGAHFHSCEQPALYCPGGSDFGTAEEQVSAVKKALDNGGVHPDCPGCAVNRRPANSTTICMTRKGDECHYDCPTGFVPTGAHICQDDGSYSGGACIVPVVDTETHELMSPSPLPLPSPSAAPSVIVATAQDVVHENWTVYDEKMEQELTAKYQRQLHEDICLYLLDFENELHSRQFTPRKPLRYKLYTAAKAAACDWFHEEVYTTTQERKHLIPVRGDHGPWPEIMTPNIVHITTSRGENIAVVIDLQNALGLDLYKAVAERLQVKNDAFSIYAGIHPIEIDAPLTRFNIKVSDFLHLEYGDQRGWAQPTPKQLGPGEKATLFDNDNLQLLPNQRPPWMWNTQQQ